MRAPGRVVETVARQDHRPPVYSGDKARGADIVLRRPWERAVFIAGLAGAVVLGLVLAWLAW
jgi:hypothetical protein